MSEGGEKVMMGWYTTRWVEAADEEEAKQKALAALKSEPSLANVPQGCGATVTWEEVQSVEKSKVPSTQGGFTFFPMNETSANQSESECKT